MSVSPVLFNAEMFRQSRPWKSAWRINLERDMAARGVRADQVGRRPDKPVARVTGRAEGYLAVESAPERRDGSTRRGRPRMAASARVQRVPKLRPCDQHCGSQVRGEHRTTCSRCQERRNTPRPDCKNLCGGKVNKTNPHGFCKLCFQKVRRTLESGARRVCAWHDATQQCAELIFRHNRAGVCGFHRPRMKGKFRNSAPSLTLRVKDSKCSSEGGAA